jgi:glycosyltransferase involved in cell wall biosynthesis
MLNTTALHPHLLCIGGEDHRFRIPFMLALQNQGFRVTAAGSGNQTPFERAKIEYCQFAFDRFVNPVRDNATIGTLRRLIEQVRPNIAQSFDTKPNVLLPLAARGLRNVAAVRTINGMGWVYSSRSPIALALRPVQRILHRCASRHAAATIFQNSDDKTFFESHRLVESRRSHLILGSGVDIDSFERARAAGPAPRELRAELGLGAAEIVMTVARITRQKGIPTLLRAAAIVHAQRPNVRFVLVGPRHTEGPFAVPEAEIRQHAPYVIAIGERSDVPSLLRLADVFAFPTEYREGVPRALLEAGLAGLPIVATDMPGCNDVVRDGWNGTLVPTRSPRVLASAICRLLDDRKAAAEMGQRAAELVRNEFSLDLTVSRYCRIYAQLVNKVSAAADSAPRLAAAAQSRTWN